MVGLCILIASLLPQPARVSTVGDNAKWIGERLGMTVTVQPKLAKELLFISNLDYPPEKLLPLVARAEHASVRSTAGGLVLERSAADLKTLAENERKERAEWIRARQKRVAEYRQTTLGSGDVAGALTRAIDAEQTAFQNFLRHGGTRPPTLFPSDLLPGQALIDALIQRIGIDELASIPANRTVIYENNPLEHAVPFPPCSDLVNAYMKQSAPYETVSLPSESTQEMQGLMQTPYFSQVGQPTQRPARLRLRVTVSKVDQVFELEGFDAGEKRVLHAAFGTDGPTRARPDVGIAGEELVKPNARWSPISQETQQVASVVTRDLPRGEPAPEWLAHPENSEPMNVFVSDCLRAFAAQTPDKCTVVDVDDFFWKLAGLCCKDGKLCTSAFQSELDEVEDYEKVEDGASIVLRPRSPEAVEDARANRKVLGRSVRDLIARNGERLRTLSLLSHDASAETSILATTFARYAMQVSPTDLDDALLVIRDPAYRLLGGISDEAWTKLKFGEPQPVGRLDVTGEARALLVSEAHSAHGEQPVSDLKHHPIELYDRDPMEATSISIQPSEKTVMRSQNPKGTVSMWEGAAGFARTIGGWAVNRLPGFNTAPAGQDVFEQRVTYRVGAVNEHATKWKWSFQTAVQSISTITIHLPYGQRIEFVLSTIHDPSPLGAYLDLPQNVRNELYKAAVEVGERESAVLRNAQGNQPPPVKTIPP